MQEKKEFITLGQCTNVTPMVFLNPKKYHKQQFHKIIDEFFDKCNRKLFGQKKGAASFIRC